MSRKEQVYERANIRAMQGYSYGEQPEDGRTIKLNTNENPYPASPRVQAALAGVDISSLRTYPQATANPLRKILSELHGVPQDHIVVTNGGDEALRLALTTFVEPGQNFGMAEPSYSLYPVLAQIQDAGVHRVSLSDDWQYPDDFCTQLNQAGVALTCVVNPHAPSGTLLDIGQLEHMAAELDGVLLIDEAYADFIDPAQGYNTTTLPAQFNNVLILRTFSKGYSLAGLRLGYLLGSPGLIDPIVSKTRDSYNVDHLSQVLGVAAIEDQAYARETWQKVRKQRTLLQNNLRQLGLTSPPSQSNFLLVDVPPECKLSAAQIYAALKQAGVLVRYFDTLSRKIRITVGTAEENDTLLKALTHLLN